jgi:hypothetical protein
MNTNAASRFVAPGGPTPGSVSQAEMLEIAGAFNPPGLVLCAVRCGHDQCSEQDDDPENNDQFNYRERLPTKVSGPLHDTLLYALTSTAATDAQVPNWLIG